MIINPPAFALALVGGDSLKGIPVLGVMFYRRLSDLVEPLWPCHKWYNSVKLA